MTLIEEWNEENEKLAALIRRYPPPDWFSKAMELETARTKVLADSDGRPSTREEALKAEADLYVGWALESVVERNAPPRPVRPFWLDLD